MSDPVQRKRIGFFGLGALSYLPTAAFLAFGTAEGVVPMPVLVGTLATHLAINLVFLGVFVAGWNLRFERDRTLAMPQIVTGIVSNWWVLAILGPWRSTYLVMCVTPLLFGALKLRPVQMLRLAGFAQAGHLAIVLAAGHWVPDQLDLRHELVLWATLTIEMLWVAGIAAMIGNLRRRLLRANAESHRLAHSDPLTGVLNRRALIEQVQAVAGLRPGAAAGAAPAAPLVALLDLDHFKMVNDGYGHEVGDRMLVAFADAVRNCIREDDVFGRYGGDEFVLCLAARQAPHAREVFERLQRTVADIELRDCPEVGATVSIGATRLRPGETIDAALQRADALLYSVKRSGRGRAVLDEGHDDDAGPQPQAPGAARRAPASAH